MLIQIYNSKETYDRPFTQCNVVARHNGLHGTNYREINMLNCAYFINISDDCDGKAFEFHMCDRVCEINIRWNAPLFLSKYKFSVFYAEIPQIPFSRKLSHIVGIHDFDLPNKFSNYEAPPTNRLAISDKNVEIFDSVYYGLPRLFRPDKYLKWNISLEFPIQKRWQTDCLCITSA